MENKQSPSTSKVQKLSASTVNIRKNTSRSKINVLEKFNSLGAYQWVNMESMEKKKPYLLTDLKRATTKFGERIIAEMNGDTKMYLPERYNIFTDRQLGELCGGNYILINHGQEGKMYKLELTKKEDVVENVVETQFGDDNDDALSQPFMVEESQMGFYHPNY